MDAAPRRGSLLPGGLGPRAGPGPGRRAGRLGLLAAGGAACQPGGAADPRGPAGSPPGPGSAPSPCPGAGTASQAAAGPAGHPAPGRPHGRVGGNPLFDAGGPGHLWEDHLPGHGRHAAGHVRRLRPAGGGGGDAAPLRQGRGQDRHRLSGLGGQGLGRERGVHLGGGGEEAARAGGAPPGLGQGAVRRGAAPQGALPERGGRRLPVGVPVEVHRGDAAGRLRALRGQHRQVQHQLHQ